ncbi:MAG: hypothetical protein VB118_00110 [Oscillospiraceae bacterium]|nr:hypothetical protein [Oscillospiraceae bacterium]
MNVNIHDAIMAWLMSYKPLAEWYFNISKAEDDTICIVPVDGSESRPFIDGSEECVYPFEVQIYKSFGENPIIPGVDNENTGNFFDVQQMISWIEQQEEIGNYPDFGQGVTMLEAKVLRDIPFTAGVDEHIIKITFPVQITYIKE